MLRCRIHQTFDLVPDRQQPEYREAGSDKNAKERLPFALIPDGWIPSDKKEDDQHFQNRQSGDE